MKIFKKYVVLLLFFGFLADRINETTSGDIGEDLAIGSLPILSSMSGVTFSGPLAPIMVGSFLVLSLASTILQNKANPTEDLTKQDFLEQHAKLAESLESVNNQLSDVSAQLIDITESHAFFEEMRNDLDALRESVSDNFNSILNPNLSGLIKTKSMHAMLDYYSSFRQILRSFVTKYIKPKGVLVATGDVNLFYDFILRRHKNAVDKGDDCESESIHTKLFISFMYILKTLTDAYAMTISAHTVQYQTELRANDVNAAATLKVALKLLDQSKADIKVLMDKTKWALDTASREIRNCGTFDSLEEGTTFKRVSFAHTLPIFKDWAVNAKAYYSIHEIPQFQCNIRENVVKYEKVETRNCKDIDMTMPSALSVFVNPGNCEWPFVYLKNDPTIGAVQTYGNISSNLPGLIKHEFHQTVLCVSQFCDAFKNKVIGVSTQLISVDEGNVITGVRLSIRNNILNIDIRQGTLEDDLTVDPESLVWQQTPSNGKVLYLDSNIRKFELGDIEVQGNDYLKTIQFQLKNKDEGIIGLSVNGQTSSPTKSYEVNLSGSEGADKFGADVKNMVSKAPVPSKPYHVSLQPSDFRKNLGATTIPYFDLRNVVTYPEAPLSGIGFYHQTVKGSGGFISLKIKNINLSRFVDYNSFKKIIDSTLKI